MNKKTIIEDIKTILFGKEVVEKFLDAKSGDLILRVEADAFAPKLPLLVVTPEGVIPAEDGEYILEDGMILEVKAGLIDEISTQEEDVVVEEAPVEEVMSEEIVEETEEVMSEEEVVVEEVVEEEPKSVLPEELLSRLEKLEKLIEEMSKENKSVSEFSKMVENKLDTFVDGTPAELEFKSIKSEYNSIETNKNKTENNLDRIKNLRKK
ncbi:MAG: hypothetical protein ACOVK2_02945 [Candidatus Fonsibacter sp.]